MIKLRNVSLKNLTEVRIELEKIVLVYALTRITENDLNALEDAILRAENTISTGRTLHEGKCGVPFDSQSGDPE